MYGVEAYFKEWQRAYRAERKLAAAQIEIAGLQRQVACLHAERHGQSWAPTIVRQLRHAARLAVALGISCDSFISRWAEDHGRTPRAVYFQLERMGLAHGGPPA